MGRYCAARTGQRTELCVITAKCGHHFESALLRLVEMTMPRAISRIRMDDGKLLVSDASFDRNVIGSIGNNQRCFCSVFTQCICRSDFLCFKQVSWRNACAETLRPNLTKLTIDCTIAAS